MSMTETARITGTTGSARWRAQRWLFDTSVDALGISFDQTRLGYSLGCVRDDLAGGEMAYLRGSIRKLADLLPLAQSSAERREHLAQRAQEAGHLTTASTHWYAAAQLWLLSTWGLWETTDQLVETHARKHAAFMNWAAHADHRVEAVEVPFERGTLPGYFHLPPGFDGSPVPTVLAVDGMDSGRETQVARVGEEFLAAGFAVLAMDGPGMSESAVRGIHTSPQAWVGAGEAMVAWLLARPEVDVDRLVCTGTSFGSYFMTLVASTQPVFRGCAVAMPCFEPGMDTIFEQAAPSYKARHMWMAGLERDEPAFDAMAAGYDLREAIAGMPMPWYVVGGEADDLSPNHWVYDLADRCPAAVTTLMYDGATHSMDQSPAVILGPPWRVELIDWLSSCVTAGAGEGSPAGKQLHQRVTRTGQVVPR